MLDPQLIIVIFIELVALATAAVGFLKIVWPKIKSTDNAVNHGRMERIEQSVVDNNKRIDRIEMDNRLRHDAVVDRLDNLMLSLMKDK